MRLSIAIVGATGLVGRELMRIIEVNEPSAGLGLFASASSAGKRLPFGSEEIVVEDLASCDFSRFRAALFCIGDELSAEYVPKALEAGCCIVDKSNAFRLAPAVPLVVAGVNDSVVGPSSMLCANPNCSTIILLHSIAPILRRFGLSRVWVSTYQSVSGAGGPGVDLLAAQLEACGRAQSLLDRASYDPLQYAYNVVPAIGKLDELGRCGEEAKLVEESRKVLDLPYLPIVAHAVRVPVVVGHSMAVTVELQDSASQDELVEAFGISSSIMWMGDALPTPLGAARHNKVEVGRLRQERGLDRAYSFFVSGDNLRLGAALNGWRILDLMRQSGAVGGDAQSAA